MIEAHELTKRYSDKTAVDSISFTIAPGSVTGFLGPKCREVNHHAHDHGTGPADVRRTPCSLEGRFAPSAFDGSVAIAVMLPVWMAEVGHALLRAAPSPAAHPLRNVRLSEADGSHILRTPLDGVRCVRGRAG